MLFSEKFKINLTGDEDWFDPVLNTDTLLFIDPILVFQNELEEFSSLKEKILSFFQIAFEAVLSAKGNLGPARNFALSTLQFKEVPEIRLGYTNYGSHGSGMGPGFARLVFDAMVDFIDLGLEDLGSYLSPFEMFVEGIGADRISDMTANIIKEDLIKYTQKICKENKIPLQKFTIKNYSYKRGVGWLPKKVELPKNPLEKGAVILVPKDFLRSETSGDEIRDFEEYLCHIENSELRQKVTRLFTGDLNKKKLRLAINRDPQTINDVFGEYMKHLEEVKRVPYDLSNDPNLLYWFVEEINKLKKRLPEIKTEKEDFESLKNFVNSIILQFKQIVEGREGYRLLFNDDETPKEERASQILFWGIAETMCKLNTKVTFSREGQTGRGPVDFRFSKGYPNRIHVEIKLAKSTKIYPGLEKQLVTYMESDEVEFGNYVVIKLLGGDNVRAIRLQDRYDKLPENIKKKILIKIIDAYPGEKKSASKL